MSWWRKQGGCRVCTTDRRPHRASGMCSFCYRVTLRIRQVEKWTLGDRKVLKGVQSAWVPSDTDEFRVYRSAVLEQLRSRLRVARHRERLRRGRVDGLSLEYLLRRLASRAGARNRNLHFGIAGYLEGRFGPAQRRALFGLLSDIEESYETVSINWRPVWDAVENCRAEQQRRARRGPG